MPEPICPAPTTRTLAKRTIASLSRNPPHLPIRGERRRSRGASDEPIYHAMSEALPSPPPIYQPQVQDGPPVMGAAAGPLPPSSAPAGDLPDDGQGKPVFLTFEQPADVLGRLRELLPSDARFS